MRLFFNPGRPPRPGEWTTGKAILFIVTLAAKGNVTLAARDVGMSRKSAYALRQRNSLFANAWDAAARAAAADPSNRPGQGDGAHLAPPSTSSSAKAGLRRAQHPFSLGPALHDRLCAELQRTASDSPFGGKMPRLAPRPASR